jgi:glycosyltransferase involved in cell wall biosynthesis
MRVLLLHNRYRFEGGEERSVELQLRALANAGIEHRLFERRSAESGRVAAALAILRGGASDGGGSIGRRSRREAAALPVLRGRAGRGRGAPEREVGGLKDGEVSDARGRTEPAHGGPKDGGVAAAVREFGADLVHAHNMQPLIGPRGLAAARAAGARVVLHLHNARLFCAIGVAARDGGPCFRCRGRNTLPGLVLNCRGSVPEAVVYAAGLAAHQPLVFESVARFVAPSGWAAGQLALLGVPRERLDVLPHYVPESEVAPESLAHEGRYALAAGRLAPEKGFETAIEAAAQADVPLRIAGDGPSGAELARLARERAAPVEFLGRVPRTEMPGLLTGAAMLVLSSRCHEFSPYSVLEAMGAGVPVVATRSGGVPELIGPERCVPRGDPDALAGRMRALWLDPGLRRTEGEALLERARGSHSEERYIAGLLEIYDRARV